MTILYISTDEFEAETIIEDVDPNKTPRHLYYDIGMAEGEKMKERIGFNPMSKVELSADTRPQEITDYIRKLVMEGQLVTIESDESVERYKPNNLLEREATVRHALAKYPKQNYRFGYESGLPTLNLLRYSNMQNLPNKIEEF